MSLPEDSLLKQLKKLEKSLTSESHLSAHPQSAKAGRTLTNGETTEILNRAIRTVSQKRRRTIHQLVLIAEAGGRCGRCEGVFHPYIYDFHHKNPAVKAFSLDRSVFGKSLSSLRAEAAKCVLLCANCHREVHTFLDTRFLVINDVPTPEVIYVPMEVPE